MCVTCASSVQEIHRRCRKPSRVAAIRVNVVWGARRVATFSRAPASVSAGGPHTETRRVTRHAARARRTRGLLRGGARRAATRHLRPAELYHASRASVLRRANLACLAPYRRCLHFGNRASRHPLLCLSHVSLHRRFYRLGPLHGRHRSHHV